MIIEENVPLADLTTFKIGGPARFLITILKESELPEAVSFAKKQNLPFIPLGSGSNILAPDEGVQGVFVRYAPDRVLPHTVDGTVVRVSAEARCPWDGFVAYAVSNEWWGTENLSAIPGTVGAAVVQNIGAYGAAISEIVSSVAAFDTTTLTSKVFSNAECRFGYRTSVFKKEKDRYLITSVAFQLSLGAVPRITYKDLAARFADSDAKSLTLHDIRRAVIEIRKGKFPALSEYGTAGSFFLNPVVSQEEAERIQGTFPGMPLFPMPEGGVKVPLAWILDRVLQLKGTRTGAAFLWEKQPIVITIEHGATSDDVRTLANLVRKEVHEKTGIVITPEVRIL